MTGASGQLISTLLPVKVRCRWSVNVLQYLCVCMREHEREAHKGYGLAATVLTGHCLCFSLSCTAQRAQYDLHDRVGLSL